MTESGASRPRTPIECRGRTLHPKRAPLVMGVLNVTPDSFSDGGAHDNLDAACRRAHIMVSEGADLIDVGGESTRPGAESITVRQELERVLPVVEALVGSLDVPISVDTRRAAVASAVLEAGCHLINDVSAAADPEMPAVLKAYGVPVIIMHMKGDPRSMQNNPTYEDVVAEVRSFLRERAEFLEREGIAHDRIIIDPGIGFGKRFRDNLDLLAAAASFRTLGYPLLIGASRKRFLGELLDEPAGERLSGSLAVAAHCNVSGVDIVRVHDVKDTVGLLRVLDAIENPGSYGADW